MRLSYLLEFDHQNKVQNLLFQIKYGKFIAHRAYYRVTIICKYNISLAVNGSHQIRELQINKKITIT